MKIIKEPIEKYLLRNNNVTWLKVVQRAFPNTIIGGGAARLEHNIQKDTKYGHG